MLLKSAVCLPCNKPKLFVYTFYRGNVNLMKAREGVMSNPEFGEKLNQLYPVVEPEMSDSGCLDNVVEFLGLFLKFFNYL